MKIIGFMQTTDLDQYKKEKNFKIIGGIKDKKGLLLTHVCNTMQNKYKNTATTLLEDIEEYAKNRHYDYILLRTVTSRDYLHSGGDRIIYKKWL